MSLPAANDEKTSVDFSNSGEPKFDGPSITPHTPTLASMAEGSKGPGQATTPQTGLHFAPGTKMDTEFPTNLTRRTRSMGWESYTLETGTTQTVLNSPRDPSPPMYGPHRQVNPDRMPSVPHTKRSMSETLKSLMKPKKRVSVDPTAAQSLRAIMLESWLNVLLVFIPVSWALHFSINNDTVIFITAFLAIIPLTKLIGFATEELCIRVGEVLGTFFNVSLGNTVVLIISIVALTKCQLRVVQAALTGSILSNLLFLLGLCCEFFVGGTKFCSQGFHISAAQLNSSLLMISVVAVIVPTAFFIMVSGTHTTDLGTLSPENEAERLLKMSRGVSFVLLFLFGCTLAYRLWSHFDMYDNPTDGSVPRSQRYPATLYRPSFSHMVDDIKEHFRKSEEELVEERVATNSDDQHVGQDSSVGSEPNLRVPAPSCLDDGRAGTPTIEVTLIDGPDPRHEEEDEKEEIPKISSWAAWILLVVATVLVAFTAEILVGRNNLFNNPQLSQEWVAFVLLPFVSGGAAGAIEQLAVLSERDKFKLDHTISITVGSSIQIALVVTPFDVVLAWILGKPLTLLFDPFEAVMLYFSVVTYNHVVADGETNWLEGMILMCLYVVIAVAFFFYPGVDPASHLFACVV